MIIKIKMHYAFILRFFSPQFSSVFTCLRSRDLETACFLFEEDAECWDEDVEVADVEDVEVADVEEVDADINLCNLKWWSSILRPRPLYTMSIVVSGEYANEGSNCERGGASVKLGRDLC